MRILIDGDAFPDIKEVILLAKRYNKEIIIFVDTSHILENDYAKVITVDKSANSVDLVIQNEVKNNDLVLTQDYGVAVIALLKGAYSLNQLGYFYTNDNIDYLMEIRNVNRKLRKHQNIKGPKKRTSEDKERLLNSIVDVISRGDVNDR